MATGYLARQDHEWMRVAWLACNALAGFSKDKITPEKLLGPSFMAAMRQRRSPTHVATEADEETEP